MSGSNCGSCEQSFSFPLLFNRHAWRQGKLSQLLISGIAQTLSNRVLFWELPCSVPDTLCSCGTSELPAVALPVDNFSVFILWLMCSVRLVCLNEALVSGSTVTFALLHGLCELQMTKPVQKKRLCAGCVRSVVQDSSYWEVHRCFLWRALDFWCSRLPFLGHQLVIYRITEE